MHTAADRRQKRAFLISVCALFGNHITFHFARKMVWHIANKAHDICNQLGSPKYPLGNLQGGAGALACFAAAN